LIMPVFAPSQLVMIGTEMFKAVGVPEDQARITAEVLVAANVHGVDSHGVSRIPGYVRSVRSWRVSPSVRIRVLKETSTTAT
jgi:L-2-hydroxycarboxylate dehydrogenase (NAD+)